MDELDFSAMGVRAKEERSRAAALLVFLLRTAGAGIVASDLGARAPQRAARMVAMRGAPVMMAMMIVVVVAVRAMDMAARVTSIVRMRVR
jgi:hypothetical protein